MTNFYDPFGFRDMDKRNDLWKEKVRTEYLPGIDAADLKAGMRVTISPNLRREDNSYTTYILRVIAVNQMHVQVRREHPTDDKPILLLATDHYFYNAADFEEM